MAQNTDQLLANFGSTKGGLSVPLELAAARGDLGSDVYVTDKFGHNPVIEAGTVPEDIWAYGGLYTFSTAAAALYISSSSASDTEVVEVEGFDANWARQTQTVTLAGQTKTEIGSGLTWIRCFRAKNANGATLVGNVYVYEDDTVVAGVPQTASKVRAMITAGDNQTQQAIFSVEANHEGFVRNAWLSGNRGVGATATACDAAVYVREFGGVFQLKRDVGWHSYAGKAFLDFGYMLKLPAKSDILVRCTSVSATLNLNAGFQVLSIPS